MDLKFFRCNRCGNIVVPVESKETNIMCCGGDMTELIANTTDAAQEKHVPVHSLDGTKVMVSVGSVPHPMLEEHYIQWVALQTKQGWQLKYLTPGTEPKVNFLVCEDDEVEAVYEYCNLHGLWKV